MAEEALECRLRSSTDIIDEDEMLVSATREDTEAMGRLYDKYYSKIVGYIYHCTFDSIVTEDLTSNVFLAALKHIGRYKSRRIPFRAWLYRIATNEVRMYWRRQKRGKAISLQTDDSGLSEQNCELESDNPSAGDRIAAEEEYRLLHRALLELRMKYRTVIILRYYEDKAIAEICEITGRKEGTVKSQLHRGLAKLQDILVRWGVLPE
ncbi:MAG: RNA polymerase sigma factor [Planctomycetes bacterium]|nr:RNA polymerase sigma factor [Planctomycetota bacterium]MBL7146397.1 RNA polymerase sigma factor [Phycisphaerae bacterium]